jgi:undecaprenyl-diphosphatase
MPFIGLDLFKALALGLIVGLTEFLPVSTDGHLLLAQRLGGLDAHTLGASFVPFAELAALLALLSVYWRRLSAVLTATAADDASARRFLLCLLLATLPALILGALAHDFIRGALFNVWIVCFALIAGGAILAWADRPAAHPRYPDAKELPLSLFLLVALAQCVSLVPGVSRAGATIVATRLGGADRRAAADFSLWLAMPMLAGSLASDFYRNPPTMSSVGSAATAVGFAAAFVAAWCVARAFPDFVSQRGFAPFAWWRVILGSLGLMALALGL